MTANSIIIKYIPFWRFPLGDNTIGYNLCYNASYTTNTQVSSYFGHQRAMFSSSWKKGGVNEIISSSLTKANHRAQAPGHKKSF